MTNPPAPSLHVACSADPARGGMPAGELLFSAIVRAAAPDDRTLLFGSSRDRDTAGELGLGRVWLARKPRGIAARRVVSATIARAARTLASQTGRTARVVFWSAELDALEIKSEVDRPPLDRHPSGGLLSGQTAPPAALQDGDGPDDLLGDLTNSLPPRDSARAALGLGEDEPVLVPLVASPAHVDARAIAFVSGVSDLLGLHHTLVLPAQSKRLREAVRFIRLTGLGTRVLISEPPHLCALPAADVLITPERFGQGEVARVLTALADHLRLPIASTAGWDTAPGLGQGTLPPEIKATVGPAVEALQRLCPSGA